LQPNTLFLSMGIIPDPVDHDLWTALVRGGDNEVIVGKVLNGADERLRGIANIGAIQASLDHLTPIRVQL
jgi:hypothetical protein